MGHEHGHGHGHGHGLGHGHGTASAAHRGRLVAVLAMTSLVFVVQVIGAWVSGSLALLADAGHMALDTAGVAMALVAIGLAQRPPTLTRTFGLRRVEILAAFGNALLLFLLAGYVICQVFDRIGTPPELRSDAMLLVAFIGLVANAVSLWILHQGQSESLNLRGAYLEVLGDLLGSVAVIAAALVIEVTGWRQADVVASAVVVVLILPRAWALLKDAIDVLLEATPRTVDLDEVRAHIHRVPGVIGVHDLHAWTITSGMPVLSAHVVVADQTFATDSTGRMLDALCRCLASHFDVEHSTFQIEPLRQHQHGAHEVPAVLQASAAVGPNGNDRTTRHGGARSRGCGCSHLPLPVDPDTGHAHLFCDAGTGGSRAWDPVPASSARVARRGRHRA